MYPFNKKKDISRMCSVYAGPDFFANKDVKNLNSQNKPEDNENKQEEASNIPKKSIFCRCCGAKVGDETFCPVCGEKR